MFWMEQNDPKLEIIVYRFRSLEILFWKLVLKMRFNNARDLNIVRGQIIMSILNADFDGVCMKQSTEGTCC